MNRASSTVSGYLYEYLRHNQVTDSSPWVPPETARRVEAAAQQAGGERLKPIFELLAGNRSQSR